ncbi:hypothetical protein FACS1894124_5210 [Spirochaetia bacterium]|jgi:hypothetical protein|nr:hypothetical protein FACS1894124_5210 [Spirochaetia bacterium]
MKLATLLALLVATSVSAPKAMALSCIDKGSDEKIEAAYRRQVRDAVSGKGKIKKIVKTADDFHDPEYDVTLANGKTVHVTCDDSGDDQCGCEIDDGKKE